jgi:glutathione S-transferase
MTAQSIRPTITGFADSPDLGEGHARDMQVRWALEEVGRPYDVRLLSFAALKQPPHRALNPFGSIPTYEEGALALFESGAIVFHIAQSGEGLFAPDADARARAVTWMFAALNTVEPPIAEREAFLLLENEESWFEARLPRLDGNVRKRLGELSARLADSEWLDGGFSAGDLLMVSALRRLKPSNIPERAGILDEFRNLADYVARGEARPAYRRAFAAQRAVFLAGERRKEEGRDG